MKRSKKQEEISQRIKKLEEDFSEAVGMVDPRRLSDEDYDVADHMLSVVEAVLELLRRPELLSEYLLDRVEDYWHPKE